MGKLKYLKFLIYLLLLISMPLQSNPVELKYKISQMLLIGFDGTHIHNDYIKQAINTYHVGGVILFDYNAQSQTFPKNIQNPEQVKRLTHSLTQLNRQAYKQSGQAVIPLLIAVDYEGGQVTRLNEAYGFPKAPSPAAVGQMSDEQARKAADKMAATLKKYGFNLDFAPSLDVNVNPDNPIIGKKERSFSNDPQQVIHFASIYQRAFEQHHILCAYKHFPGHGSSSGDSHLGFVDVSDSWQENELLPYQHLLSKKSACPMIMTAHLVNNQLDPSEKPATLSYQILTKILRDKLHFQGVIITDDLQMKAISNHYTLEEAVVQAINAGADMLTFGNNLSSEPLDIDQFIQIIEKNVENGTIKPERIDDAYQRIIDMKKKLDPKIS